MFEDEPWRRYGCNSFPFLAWELNMHQGHVYKFSSHFGELEHVFEVQIWIMDIKCLGNSISVWKGEMNRE